MGSGVSVSSGNLVSIEMVTNRWKLCLVCVGLVIESSGSAQEVKLLAALKGHGGWAMSVAFGPDGKTIAAGCGDGRIKLWDAKSRNNTATLSGHSDPIMSVAFSPDGKTLASATNTYSTGDLSPRV